MVLHTFHGHVLEGYFSPVRSAFFIWIERILARLATRLIVVSEEVGRALIRLKIAEADRIKVVPLGFDLERFVVSDEERQRLRVALRSELSIPLDRRVVTFVGRVVPIKRVDRLIAIAHRIRQREDVHLLIVGDGELRPQLESSASARALGDRVTWTGFRRDLVAIYCASDVVALTSDSEGTPVSLIEAQAAGVPVVTTDVGGARDVVEDGVNGRVLDPGDEASMAAAITEVLTDPDLAHRFALAGRRHSLSRFALDRLVRDIDELTRGCLPSTAPERRSRARRRRRPRLRGSWIELGTEGRALREKSLRRRVRPWRRARTIAGLRSACSLPRCELSHRQDIQLCALPPACDFGEHCAQPAQHRISLFGNICGVKP